MTTSVATAEASGWMVGDGVEIAVPVGCTATRGAQLLSIRSASTAQTALRVRWSRMERIGVTSGRPPSVNRPEGSTAVFLTFEGIREANVRERDTRIRIALQGPQAVQLWRLLGERLTDEEKASA